MSMWWTFNDLISIVKTPLGFCKFRKYTEKLKRHNSALPSTMCFYFVLALLISKSHMALLMQFFCQINFETLLQLHWCFLCNFFVQIILYNFLKTNWQPFDTNVSAKNWHQIMSTNLIRFLCRFFVTYINNENLVQNLHHILCTTKLLRNQYQNSVH